MSRGSKQARTEIDRVGRTSGGEASRDLLRSEAGVIRGVIIRGIIMFGLLGLVVYDGGQLVIAQVRAESVSRAAAQAGANTFFLTKRPDLAEKEALAAAALKDASATVTAFSVAKDGTVSVTVTKVATTLVVKRLGVLKKYNLQQATDEEIRTS